VALDEGVEEVLVLRTRTIVARDATSRVVL
jgi:hypothetical protein